MKFGAREFVFFTLLLGLLAGSWYFVFKRANDRRAYLQAEIERKEQDLENLRRSTAGIEDLGKKIAELQQAIAFFESKLPQEKEMDKILKEVWQMAQANSLECRTIKTLRAERLASYSEQPIELVMSGDFAGFYSFLLQLEKLPRITRLSQMNLQKITSADGQMTARVTLSVFFEPDTASSTAASSVTAVSARP
ncbi:MAG: type 4a pilus biogenesis protein PilO [Tepidisphaerales bacterium]